jgi:predicted GTPase
LGQLQENIQSVQSVAGDRIEEIEKAVREAVMMEARAASRVFAIIELLHQSPTDSSS